MIKIKDLCEHAWSGVSEFPLFLQVLASVPNPRILHPKRNPTLTEHSISSRIRWHIFKDIIYFIQNPEFPTGWQGAYTLRVTSLVCLWRSKKRLFGHVFDVYVRCCERWQVCVAIKTLNLNTFVRLYSYVAAGAFFLTPDNEKLCYFIVLLTRWGHISLVF